MIKLASTYKYVQQVANEGQDLKPRTVGIPSTIHQLFPVTGVRDTVVVPFPYNPPWRTGALAVCFSDFPQTAGGGSQIPSSLFSSSTSWSHRLSQ